MLNRGTWVRVEEMYHANGDNALNDIDLRSMRLSIRFAVKRKKRLILNCCFWDLESDE